MANPLSWITQIENKSNFSIVFHISQGGTTGKLIMQKLINPDEHIDICHSAFYRSDSRRLIDHISSYAYVEGSHQRRWVHIGSDEIRNNAKLILHFDIEDNRVKIETIKGNNMGRLRMVVGLKNVVKKIGDKLPRKGKALGCRG